tara:strand:- start:1887 stop:2687 length:801 start_codon:yes stop_codon:yes gene_type:complete
MFKYTHCYLLFFTLSILLILFYNDQNLIKNYDPLLGVKANLGPNWIGNQPVKANTPILILAGHADSQGISGRGTPGEAVAIKGQSPMQAGISDELYWNLKLVERLVSIGKKRGLTISSYVPPIRNLEDPNDPLSNWSVGADYALKGGYVIEIHFDAYGEYGFGSGLIPPISANLNDVDESLAKSFGRFPLFFRGGLGAPRRQIRVLEIGKLEGILEKNLRNLETRETTLELIANRIIQAILLGVAKNKTFSPLPDKEDIFLPMIYR